MDHWDRYAEFLTEVTPLVASGDVAYAEDIAEGLANAAAAFMAMLKGGKRGKQIVRIG
jgi:NADPH-dependent curcumin reductase CurA